MKVFGDITSYTKRRMSESDELYIRFIAEQDEVLPFPDNLFPFSQFVIWANDYSQMAEALNILGVETQEVSE